MVQIANALSRRSHNVQLLLSSAKGSYEQDVYGEIEIFDFRCKRILSTFPKLVTYLKKESPDALLSALNHCNLIAICAARLSGSTTRVVVSERNVVSRAVSGSAKHLLIRLGTRFLYPLAASVICVSKGVQNDLRALGLPEDNLVTIYNPVEIEQIQALVGSADVHKWLLVKDRPVIVAVGRLSPQKDYPTLLHAFATLRKKRKCRLIILGEGPDEAALQSSAQRLGLADDVYFAGFQRNPFCWMAKADLYVLSSQYEGFPGTLLQAMACGCRVVSTDCPSGPRELLEAGRWGRLVPTKDPHQLAQAMDSTLNATYAPDVRLRAKDFEPAAIVRQYEEQLLGSAA